MSKQEHPYQPPPKWIDRFIERFCAPELVEEVLGDLHERYYLRAKKEGEMKARRSYGREVLAYVRPSIFRRPSIHFNISISTDMIRNYFFVAVRNITRNKAFSFINILGLALGMTCSLLIFLWVQDEYSIDDFHANSEQLFSVYQRSYNDGEIKAAHATPALLSEELKEAVPEVIHASVFAAGGKRNFRVGEEIFEMKGGSAGADFFKMFSYPLVQGTPETALAASASVAISRDMAITFFDSPESALGKTLTLDDKQDLMVTAVFENPPSNASAQFDCLISSATWIEQAPALKRWNINVTPTYIQLLPQADPVIVEAKIKNFLDTYLEPSSNYRAELGLQSFSDVYLHSGFENGEPSGGRIEYVRIFSGIAVFILLIACINFMNLATARSVKRSKEIGIRKVIGAARHTLTSQFIGETILFAIIAIAASIVLVTLLLPYFNNLTGKQLALPVTQPLFLLILISLTLITGLIAGSYPAFFLSSLQPTRVLKGTLKFSSRAVWFRKGLVVFQFVLSILLIVVTLVISQQTTYIQNKHLGYERENLLYIPMRGDLPSKYHVFKQAASSLPGIQQVDRTGNLFLRMRATNLQVDWEGKAPNTVVPFANSRVGYDYVKTMGLEVIEGRDFSRKFSTDSASFLVNEEAVKRMGFDEPIGKSVTLNGIKGPIIGVLKDFHFYSLHEPIQPLVVGLNENLPFGVALVRTEQGKTKEALASLEQAYKKINPNLPFNFFFVDEEYQKLYRSEQIITRLSNVFGGLAIFISCLGLLGLAMFSAEQRVKEIGIRKVLGASVNSIVTLFSKDFLKLVGMAFIIATPIAWFFMSDWLQGYAYRIELSWWVFALAGVLALLVTLLTISFQSIKAALANPVDSLRNE
ncbi:MAG: ABC transporter permease [Bacteroidota bacterium]